MTRKINCRKSVAEQLCVIEPSDKAVGCLVGYSSDDCLTVTTCARCMSNNVLADLENIDRYLPGGVFIIGYFHHKSKDIFKKLSTQFSQLLILTLPEDRNFLQEDNFKFWTSEEGKSSVTLNVLYEDPTEFVIARNTCCIDIAVNIGDTEDEWKKSLCKEIDSYCDLVKARNTLFKLQQSNVLIGGNQSCGISDERKCVELYNLIDDEDGGFIKGRKKRDKILDTLQFTTYIKRSGKDSYDHLPSCSPVIYHNIVSTKVVDITLHIDSLATISTEMTISYLTTHLCTSVYRQLNAMKDSLLQNSTRDNFSVPTPYHFRPTGLDTMITVVYSSNFTDENLVEKRKALHKTFCLKEDRPVFRRNNKYKFPDDIRQYGYLINPHTGIQSSGVKEGKVYTVQGLYSYHHYMQDRFDDNKWGCAYRSLQTLVSWFRLQGYTDKPIPGHNEIQQALVDIGDKEHKFVGSRQWIGSMEVSYVLDHLIGVTSKILFVSSGSELPSKGRELAQHFQTQGTPIMIGGGVLAHTILGVDFNEVTGDVKFLILDPHYTDAEDLKVILDKGWCGWKGPEFWDQTAHYNLCMPQRPICL